jgi:hypothetical protein
MSYGYFGLTFAILIVAGIFLLVASDGDVDLELDIGSGKGKASKRSKAMPKKSNIRSTSSGVNININGRMAEEIVDELTIMSDVEYVPYYTNGKQTQNYVMENSFYMAYLGSAINNITYGEIANLNSLEQQYKDGTLTMEEYKSILDKYQ